MTESDRERKLASIPKYQKPTEPIVRHKPTQELLERDFREMLTSDESRIFTVLLSRAEIALILSLLERTGEAKA